MKQLILSEGRRDVRMIKEFYKRFTRNTNIATFYGEDVEYKRLQNQESEAIRNFCQRRNPCDVLVKSENGEPALKRVFTKLIRHLVGYELDIILLIDLDERPLDTLLSELDEMVRSNYNEKFEVRDTEQVRRSSQQITTKAELYSTQHSRQRGNFDIIAFHQDLENSANINKSESEAEEIEKIQRFLDNEEAIRPMQSVLL